MTGKNPGQIKPEPLSLGRFRQFSMTLPLMSVKTGEQVSASTGVPLIERDFVQVLGVQVAWNWQKKARQTSSVQVVSSSSSHWNSWGEGEEIGLILGEVIVVD